MKNILEFLEETEQRFPEKVGFTDTDRSVTFREAVSNAKSIGSGLSKIVCENSFKCLPVAVMIDKSVACIESMFGIVYAGCFYVVVDVHSPADRIKNIFDTLHPVAIITDDASAEFTNEVLGGYDKKDSIRVLNYEKLVEADIKEEFLFSVRSQMIDTNPLYALFTSGSTGAPKGTVLSHRSVISYTNWVESEFKFDENTSFGSQTPLYFSMSVTDLFSTIRTGATFNIIPKMYFTFPMKLIEYMNEKKINTIYWVPSAMAIIANWKAFDYATPEYLKTVLFAGEVLAVKHLNYWQEKLPDCLYANLFGPTETTDICTFYVVDRKFKDTETLPIGKACDNCGVIIVTEDGHEAEQGQEGELLVKGSFLADGYYNNPEKTSAVFIQNPLNSAYPEIVYKTGDLVKINELGEIIYITRKDFQVKRMGYRIELGEIEAALNSVDKIKSAAVIYDGTENCLVAIYESGPKDTTEVLDVIKAKVPQYMVPDKVIRIKEMPHNANGKIDRICLLKEYKSY